MKVNIELIKKNREIRNWTQQQLADVCSVSLRTIQRIEKDGTASRESLASLCSAFQIENPETLLVKQKNYYEVLKQGAALSSVTYQHGLVVVATLLIAVGLVGLWNSNLDSRLWLLIASVCGGCSLLVVSLLRKK
jgi:transcriptional regulator with XRE-family HTH domain